MALDPDQLIADLLNLGLDARGDDDDHHNAEAAGPAQDDAAGPAQDDAARTAEDDAADERIGRPALQAQQLITREPIAMGLVQDGRVFAFKNIENEPHTRYAEISLDAEDRLLVHSLRRRDVPADAFIVEIDELLPLRNHRVAFLELRGPLAEDNGRVFIEVIPETSMAIHFTLMCTGQLGPTYAGSHLVGVFKQNLPGQRVYVGNPGGVTLFELDMRGTTRNIASVGQVCARSIGGRWSAQFGIITRDFHNATEYGAVFGNVTDGMDFVTAAAQRGRAITDIRVVDCGVVLPPP
ncbi:hypothetical protein GWK47_050000 [Chionoecetes opilio]|uniref:Peptidyl-prolyl cis-trans isomerase n=1 Tax=Chionoecetes opilio TaxID=41210 RepID=A0A8J5CT39_CHIOP|nr:hypothetical protein GWK47_050000 [Chionoecetes opilio]